MAITITGSGPFGAVVWMIFSIVLTAFLLFPSTAGFADTGNPSCTDRAAAWFIEEVKNVVEGMKLDDRLPLVRSS
ncbi:MAG: hypothetical protein ACLFN0_10260 [Thermovirgaceae bacterium]